MPFLSQLKSLIGGRRVNVASRFALLDESASGTMSKFYMARDLRSGEIVGLKILDREKTAAFESRFRGLKKPSEGEIAKQLKHPHVVETREHGTTTDGSPFLVMEYLEGADVQALLAVRDAHLEANRLRLLREAAEAVEAVHVAGFVHRDLCPRNLLFTKHGTKLIDFGLTVPAYGRFLEPGVRVGNPNYMAPEVIRRKPIDHRLDVFAFGVTAYKICSNQLPLAGRHHRHGGHEPRQAAGRYPRASAEARSDFGPGDSLVSGIRRRAALPLDAEVAGDDSRAGARRGGVRGAWGETGSRMAAGWERTLEGRHTSSWLTSSCDGCRARAFVYPQVAWR